MFKIMRKKGKHRLSYDTLATVRRLKKYVKFTKVYSHVTISSEEAKSFLYDDRMRYFLEKRVCDGILGEMKKNGLITFSFHKDVIRGNVVGEGTCYVANIKHR